MAPDAGGSSVKSATVSTGPLGSPHLVSSSSSKITSSATTSTALPIRTTPQKRRFDFPPDRDSDSSLSEVEGPDSEAETERLHISPQKQRPRTMLQHPGGNTASAITTTMALEIPIAADNSSGYRDDTPDKSPLRSASSTPARNSIRKRKREEKESPILLPTSEGLETKPPIFPPPKRNLHMAVASTDIMPHSTDDAMKLEDPITTNEGNQPLAISNGKSSRSPGELGNTVNIKVSRDMDLDSLAGDDNTEDSTVGHPSTKNLDEAGDPAEATRDDDEDHERDLRKQKAIEDLAEIERIFAKLKDSIYNEKLRRVEIEMKLLMDGTHPEYVAQKACIDQRLEEKVRLANAQYRHAMESLDTATHVSRAQIHSQYFQTTRQLREDTLYHCSELWYNIQRERRVGDALVPEYTFRIPDRQSTRVKQRMQYNWEVQILSGIQQHIGFPAAPDIDGASEEEKIEDLEALGISPRAVAVRSAPPGTMRLDDHFERLTTHHWPYTAHPSPPSPAGTLHQQQTHPQTHIHRHHHHYHRQHTQPTSQRVFQHESSAFPASRPGPSAGNLGPQPSSVSLSSLLQPPAESTVKIESQPVQGTLPLFKDSEHFSYSSHHTQRPPPYHPIAHHMHPFHPTPNSESQHPQRTMDACRSSTPVEIQHLGRGHDLEHPKKTKEETGIHPTEGGGGNVHRGPPGFRPGGMGYS